MKDMKGGGRLNEIINRYKHRTIFPTIEHCESGRKDKRLRYIAIPMWISLIVIYRGVPFLHISPASFNAVYAVGCLFIGVVGIWCISAQFSEVDDLKSRSLERGDSKNSYLQENDSKDDELNEDYLRKGDLKSSNLKNINFKKDSTQRNVWKNIRKTIQKNIQKYTRKNAQKNNYLLDLPSILLLRVYSQRKEAQSFIPHLGGIKRYFHWLGEICKNFSFYKVRKYRWKIVLLMVALLSAMTMSGWDIYLANKDSIVLAYGYKLSHIQTRITTPWLSSHMGCSAEGIVENISIDKLSAPSKAHVKLLASKNRCEILKNYSYSTVVLSGKIEKDSLGLHQARIKDVRLVYALSSPSWYRQIIMYMWDSFLKQCSHLSQQALILVPGITIGVLGNRLISDFHNVNDSGISLQKKAQHIEKNFKSMGITHLLAVSGGHFIIIAELLRRLLSRKIFFSHVSLLSLKIHRYAMGCVIGISMVVLAFVMAPSDSVIRALIMGVLLAMTIYSGRPYQSESALWWTIIAVLLINPTFSYRLGFIFSCAAVFGIIWGVDFIKKGIHIVGKTVIGVRIPQWIKETLAVTIAAQVTTFPVQMMIDPVVSPLSLVINAIVTPVMTIATIAGLSSLFTAWIFPWIGWVGAYISGLGTAIIAFIAQGGTLIQNHVFNM